MALNQRKLLIDMEIMGGNQFVTFRMVTHKLTRKCMWSWLYTIPVQDTKISTGEFFPNTWNAVLYMEKLLVSGLV